MRRIAITNQKGGVGKTTSSVNIGAALAQLGERVLLIDLDPQAHLTTHFGIDGQARPGTYELLTDSIPVRETLVASESGLCVIPSRIDLAAAESELISVVGREVILRDRLQELESEFDWLLIDCPPSFGVLTLNAMVAVNEVIVPLQAHFLALQGVGKLLETVNLVRSRINADLRVGGFVLCMHERATRLAGEVVDDLRRFLKEAESQDVPWNRAAIFESRIRRNIKLAECPSYGQSIFAYEPNCNGAADYLSLARELAGLDGAHESEAEKSDATPEQPVAIVAPQSSGVGDTATTDAPTIAASAEPEPAAAPNSAEVITPQPEASQPEPAEPLADASPAVRSSASEPKPEPKPEPKSKEPGVDGSALTVAEPAADMDESTEAPVAASADADGPTETCPPVKAPTVVGRHADSSSTPSKRARVAG